MTDMNNNILNTQIFAQPIFSSSYIPRFIFLLSILPAAFFSPATLFVSHAGEIPENPDTFSFETCGTARTYFRILISKDKYGSCLSVFRGMPSIKEYPPEIYQDTEMQTSFPIEDINKLISVLNRTNFLHQKDIHLNSTGYSRYYYLSVTKGKKRYNHRMVIHGYDNKPRKDKNYMQMYFLNEYINKVLAYRKKNG